MVEDNGYCNLQGKLISSSPDSVDCEGRECYFAAFLFQFSAANMGSVTHSPKMYNKTHQRLNLLVR
jgi:hypothetical protein